MPRSVDVVVDVTLTNFVRRYAFEKQFFVGDIVAPIVPVTSFKGRYKALGKELLNIDTADTAADRAETNQIGYDVTEVTYQAIERRLKILVTDKEIRSAPNALDPMKQAAITVTHALKLRQEKRIVDIASATGATHRSTPSNDWDLDAATIVVDVTQAKLLYKALMGFEPTHLVLPDHVADEVAAQQDIQAMIQAAAAMQDPTQILNTISGKALPSPLFGMTLLIPTVMYNSAEPGAALSVARVWGDDAYMFGIGSPGTGINWGVQFQSVAFTIVRWRNNDPEGWWIKAVHETDEVEVNVDGVWKFIDVT